MACYVAYHGDLADYSNSDDTLIIRLVESEGYTRGASLTRVLKSREIIRAGRDQDALRLIALASRVAPGVAEGALQILKEGDSKTQRSPISPGAFSEKSIDGVYNSSKLDQTHGSVFPFVAGMKTTELLALHAASLDELRTRKVVRSANSPGGDYAELLFEHAFGWKRAGNSFAGYDAVDDEEVRYQVKSRRIIDAKTSRQLSALRNLSEAPFDFLAAVLFKKDYSVMRAAIIPYRIVKERTTFSEHTRSSIFYAKDSLWDLLEVRDVTEQLRHAAIELNEQL